MMIRMLVMAWAFMSGLGALSGVEMNAEMKKKLILTAKEASKNAYAPYSKFYVGAALITADGTIYSGANIENASYGLTCCAERLAAFKAASEGKRDFVAMAVVVPGGGPLCGACRQVLNEFNPEMAIILGNSEGDILQETTVVKLLPDGFGPRNLR